MLNFRFLIALTAIFCCTQVRLTRAESTSVLRVCSQNLYRLGESGKSKKRSETQLEDLTKRFMRAECDVIAVQEVVGSSESLALESLGVLAKAWERSLGEKILFYVGGDSIDEHIRSGFLVRSSVGKVAAIKTYPSEPVPSVQRLGPVLYFPRAPMALVLDTPGLKPRKRFWILNIHQKSPVFGYKDGSGTDFELLRTEMAEALRNIVEREEKQEKQDTVFIVTGDRNSEGSSASAAVLWGKMELSDFERAGGCQIKKDGSPQCKTERKREPDYVGLFARRHELFPDKYPGGTYMYKKRQRSLDEISIKQKDLRLVTRENGKLSIGLEGEYFRGSDHRLVWAEFRF